MTESKDIPNPLVFPLTDANDFKIFGLQLRDLFAAAALAGLSKKYLDDRTTNVSFSEWPYVRAAYCLADAMLEERVRT